MATTKNTPAEEERKEIYIERDTYGKEANLFVSINGKNYLLPRGETSMVPVAVYNEIMRSRRAAAVRDRRKSAMLNR